jgi:carbonic anhydrase/acetyltransferase-like protein (isoleucine patch superfamily)
MFKKLLVLITVLSVLVFPSPVEAKVVYQEKGEVVIAKGETLDDDLFVGSESLLMDGSILGSVFVGTGRYTQTGSIKGDLVLGTENALISGTIGGDIYVGAGDVVLSKAVVGGNVIAGAGSVTIDNASQIGGSLIAGSGNLKNAAPVGRNVVVGAGTIYLDSKVGKEARLGGGEIALGPSTNIAGNVTYSFDEESDNLTQDQKAVIGGTISRYTPPVSEHDMAKSKEDMRKFGMVAGRGWLIISFIGSLLVGFLLLKLFPKTSLGLSTQVKSDLLRSLGIGFLIIVFAAPVLLVLSLTVIGLPLAGLLFLLLLVAVFIAKLVASYALGRFVATQFNWNKMGVYATAFVGLAIFYLLRAVPPIGWITSFLFTWTGLGAIWLAGRSNLKNL